jgi:hypothetical protein
MLICRPDRWSGSQTNGLAYTHRVPGLRRAKFREKVKLA